MYIQNLIAEQPVFHNAKNLSKMVGKIVLGALLCTLAWGCNEAMPNEKEVQNHVDSLSKVANSVETFTNPIVSYLASSSNFDSTYLGINNSILEDYPLTEVETLSFDLNMDGKMDKIIFSRLEDFDFHEDLHRIKIILDTTDSLELSNQDGWVKFENSRSIPKTILQKNQLKSDKIALVNISETQSLLFLFGRMYANDAGLLTIIDPLDLEILFFRPFDMDVFVDSNRDGYMEMNGVDVYLENNLKSPQYHIDFKDEELEMKIIVQNNKPTFHPDFEKYINSLEVIQTPYKYDPINTIGIEELSIKYDKELFKKYKHIHSYAPHGVIIKRAEFIVTVEFIAGDAIIPYFMSYDNKGNKIDSISFFQKSSYDENYRIQESIHINEDLFKVVDSTETWELDENFDVVQSSIKVTVDSTFYKLNVNGKFVLIN